MYVPKNQAAQNNVEETKEVEESKEESVQLTFDKEWIAILQLTQAQIPLEF